MTEEEIMNLPKLPRQGVRGTVYILCHTPTEWDIVGWDGGRYNCFGQEKTYEKVMARLETILWAKDWPRVLCRSSFRKVNPCIRVEFEYQDGRIQRLTGNAAERWLKNVNDIAAAGELRYGQTQMNDHPWEFTRRDA